MAANTSYFLSTTQLDFQSLKSALKSFLQGQEQFKDYNFEGPNLTVLLDILSYNTVLNALYINMAGSEMFMDSSQLRESIVSHAKELNYCPRSRSSSSLTVSISCTGNNLPSIVTIPANFQIQGRASNGLTFTFLTQEPTNVGVANNWTGNIDIYEGRLITETFVANSTARYNLQSANIDTSSVVVNIQNSSSDTTNTNWKYTSTIFGVSSNAQVFFLEGYLDNYYEIVFGNGVIGANLTPGNIITVSYRETSGIYGNGISIFSPISGIPNVNSISVALAVANTSSSGGNERESNDEVQFNGPRYFPTQGRAIAAPDYEVLLQSRFPQLETVIAYGGEEAPQKQYGKVIISAKIAGQDVLPNALKTQILSFLKGKTAAGGISPIIVDPDIYNIVVNSTVNYSIANTALTPDQLVSVVTNQIVDYDSKYLEKFDNDFRYSKLVTMIDGSDPSILSNETSILLAKKFYPVINTSSSYAFSFSNPILQDSSKPVITSSVFGYLSSGKIYNSQIQDDGEGNLYLYTVNSQNQKVILLSQAGSVDYASGNCTINSFVVSSLPSDGALVVYADPQNQDVMIGINQILEIDPRDITVMVVGN